MFIPWENRTRLVLFNNRAARSRRMNPGVKQEPQIVNVEHFCPLTWRRSGSTRVGPSRLVCTHNPRVLDACGLIRQREVRINLRFNGGPTSQTLALHWATSWPSSGYPCRKPARSLHLNPFHCQTAKVNTIAPHRRTDIWRAGPSLARRYFHVSRPRIAGEIKLYTVAWKISSRFPGDVCRIRYLVHGFATWPRGFARVQTPIQYSRLCTPVCDHLFYFINFSVIDLFICR